MVLGEGPPKKRPLEKAVHVESFGTPGQIDGLLRGFHNNHRRRTLAPIQAPNLCNVFAHLIRLMGMDLEVSGCTGD
jgi:hypothetical protein